MIIIGAKGFARQIIEVFFQNNFSDHLYFFDDVNSDLPDSLYDIPILKSYSQAENVLSHLSNEFCLGIGTPALRRKLADKFESTGGALKSVISPFAQIATYAGDIKTGVSILTGAVIENDAQIGKGVLLNTHASVHHGVRIGDFTEIAPGARLLGNCIVEEDCFIGANATILPGIKISKGAVVGAGAVVTKDVSPYSKVMGVPARHVNFLRW